VKVEEFEKKETKLRKWLSIRGENKEGKGEEEQGFVVLLRGERGN
jgi:hypothetical protein